MRPYEEKKSGKVITRKFSSGVQSSELTWHRDIRDRYVTVVEGIGWHLQCEDALPVPMLEGLGYWIEQGEWHRLIKGNSSLVLKIEEF